MECEFFSKRKQETESRDLADGFATFAQQFESCWSRIIAKPRFVRMIGSTDRMSVTGDKPEVECGGCLCHATALLIIVPPVPQKASRQDCHSPLYMSTICWLHTCVAHEKIIYVLRSSAAGTFMTANQRTES
jgi:hypothetical protein